MTKNEKLAKELLAKNTEENKVVITEDGQAFFSDVYAMRHHTDNGFEAEPQVFFREGYEGENVEGLEKALHLAEQAKTALEETLTAINIVADTEQEYEPATQETDDTLTAVIALRERYEQALAGNSELQSEIEKLKKQLENGTTQTDSKETK